MQVKCGGAVHHDEGLLGRKHGFGRGGVVQNDVDLGMTATVVRGVIGTHTLGLSWNKRQGQLGMGWPPKASALTAPCAWGPWGGGGFPEEPKTSRA